MKYEIMTISSFPGEQLQSLLRHSTNDLQKVVMVDLRGAARKMLRSVLASLLWDPVLLSAKWTVLLEAHSHICGRLQLDSLTLTLKLFLSPKGTPIC